MHQYEARGADQAITSVLAPHTGTLTAQKIKKSPEAIKAHSRGFLPGLGLRA
jgi:hypothetical protein